MQCIVVLLYKVLYFRMIIFIFPVYVLFEYITITATYREFLGTYIECKKQDMYKMSQLVKILQTSYSPHLALQHVEEVFLAMYCLYVSVEIQENTDQKKLRIWTLFTQGQTIKLSWIHIKICSYITYIIKGLCFKSSYQNNLTVIAIWTYYKSCLWIWSIERSSKLMPMENSS